MLKKITVLYSIIACSVILSVPLVAQAGQQPADQEENDSWTFSLFFENDLFSDTDQHYTNGTKFSFISQDLTEFAKSTTLPEWSKPLVKKLPFVNEQEEGNVDQSFPPEEKRIRNIVLSLGQKMYTPEDITRTDLIVEDQPYAGWTYFGAGFHTKTREKLDSIEVQLGMVGPSSFAEQTQNFVHETRKIDTAKGWNNQLNDEVGLVLIYERKWRLWEYDTNEMSGVNKGLGIDFIIHYGGAIGNVFTYVNGGAEYRVGWNMLADFGDSLMRPAGESSGLIDGSGPGLSRRRGVYLFSLLDSRAVLRNIFLDGNSFSSSHSVEKNNYVTDLGIGVCLVVPFVKISYAKAWRGKEFKGQESHHQFGSITFSFTW